MDMKLKSEQIRQLRKQKLWSQEELAAASGLSLRTVQRVEKDGEAALETVKSLASALNVQAEELVAKGAYSGYRHTQIGWSILIILLLFAAFFQFLPPGLPARWLPSTVLLLVAIVFSTLTVTVSQDELRWAYGPGLIRKREPMSEIASCEIVHNQWWWGWGIRFHPFGYWLYNVSGLDGVEITMKSGRRFRLGTDEPVYLHQAIQAAIKAQG